MWTTPIPLEDASFSEVYTRVAFRLLQIEVRRARGLGFSTSETIETLILNLCDGNFNALASWVCSFEYYRTKHGYSALYWKQELIRRARSRQRNHRLGKPWRREP